MPGRYGRAKCAKSRKVVLVKAPSARLEEVKAPQTASVSPLSCMGNRQHESQLATLSLNPQNVYTALNLYSSALCGTLAPRFLGFNNGTK